MKSDIQRLSREPKNLVVIDLRDHFEFEKFNIKGSMHFPVDDWFELKGKDRYELLKVSDFIQKLALRGADPTKNIVLISDDALVSFAFQKLLHAVGFKNMIHAEISDLRSNPFSQSKLANQKVWTVLHERFESDEERIDSEFQVVLPRVRTQAREQALQMPPPQRIPKFVVLQIRDIEKTVARPMVLDRRMPLRRIHPIQLSMTEDVIVQKSQCKMDLSRLQIAKNDFFVVEVETTKQSYVKALAVSRCLVLNGYSEVLLTRAR